MRTYAVQYKIKKEKKVSIVESETALDASELITSTNKKVRILSVEQIK